MIRPNNCEMGADNGDGVRAGDIALLGLEGREDLDFSHPAQRERPSCCSGSNFVSWSQKFRK